MLQVVITLQVLKIKIHKNASHLTKKKKKKLTMIFKAISNTLSKFQTVKYCVGFTKFATLNIINFK